jgi:hypothetical protein
MLTDNPRFQKEYQEFSEKISRISDETIKHPDKSTFTKITSRSKIY